MCPSRGNDGRTAVSDGRATDDPRVPSLPLGSARHVRARRSGIR